MGVGLAIALLTSLMVTATPTSADTLSWSTVPLPKFGSAGKWMLAPATDVGEIAISSTGSVMYASANLTASTNITDVMKSTNSGYAWVQQSAFRTAADANSDTSGIVDIMLSPEYNSDTTMFVATADYVYQTVDGGKNFTAMTRPTGWDTDEDITDMDITLDSGGRLSVMIGSTETTGFGDVYVYCPATTGMSWQPQFVRDSGTTLASNCNVLAVAFTPWFASDESIMAVGVNGTWTKMMMTFGSTQTGGGWGANIGPATFNHNGDSAKPIVATIARIALPGDFDVDSLTANAAFVALTGTYASADAGDVFKVNLVTATMSSVTDLNVRGRISQVTPTQTNTRSIAVSGDAEAASIIVGADYWSTASTPYYWLTYYSNDSGATWSSAREKSPTGAGMGPSGGSTGAETNVLMAPDFATSGIAYAATKGDWTSALSRTADGGKSWNQISLIDYSNATLAYTPSFKPDLMYDYSKTYHLFTRVTTDPGMPPLVPAVTYQDGFGAIWITTDGGTTFERLLSYANPTITSEISGFSIVGEYMFAYDKAAGKFWRSPDMGTTWPRIITAKLPAWGVLSIIDENTIFTGYDPGSDGAGPAAIWSTTNLGRPWVKPDESQVTGTPRMLTRKGDLWILLANQGSIVTGLSSKLFISTDAGETWLETIGGSDAPGDGVIPFFDPGFDDNGILYGSSLNVGVDLSIYGSPGWWWLYPQGIYRIVLDPENPRATDWKRMDGGTANINNGANKSVAVGAMIMSGTFYAFDYGAANLTADLNNAGGLWRCTNPTADLDGPTPPYFEHVNTGLSTGDSLSMQGLSIMPTTFYMRNAKLGINYYDQIVMLTETLGSAPKLTAPANAAADVGFRESTDQLTRSAVLSWETQTGATEYVVHWSTDETFGTKSVPATNPTGGQYKAEGLIAGKTYYWRVRANAPLRSPYSAVRSFSVGGEIPFETSSPALGATSLPVKATLVWTEFPDALNYEVEISEMDDFSDVTYSATAATNMHGVTETLGYSTTYFWRVRAVLATGETAWATGVFTTAALPAGAVAPEDGVTPPVGDGVTIVEVPIPGPAQAIPSYLLWTIIAVGAVLVISLIVLIVRTRRVA